MGTWELYFPVLSIYALAGFKLLPALQQIYASAAMIKGSISAFESIQDDLSNSFDQDHRTHTRDNKCLDFEHEILLENVSFTYPNKTASAINELYMSIPVNSFIGVVGPSGSGKSTLVDIILGLISPQNGRLIVDEIMITPIIVVYGRTTLDSLHKVFFYLMQVLQKILLLESKKMKLIWIKSKKHLNLHNLLN